MKLNEIQDLIKFVAKSGVSEVELETKDFKITIKAQPKDKNKATEQIIVTQAPVSQQPVVAAPQPMVAQTPAPAPAQQPPKQETKENQSGNLITIKSPMIGTFYRRPAPEKDPFVEVGSIVKPGDVLCVIEAMKLFNEIESEVSGKIVKILVDDATPVEYDQPLFLVEPI